MEKPIELYTTEELRSALNDTRAACNPRPRPFRFPLSQTGRN